MAFQSYFKVCFIMGSMYLSYYCYHTKRKSFIFDHKEWKLLVPGDCLSSKISLDEFPEKRCAQKCNKKSQFNDKSLKSAKIELDFLIIFRSHHVSFE